MQPMSSLKPLEPAAVSVCAADVTPVASTKSPFVDPTSALQALVALDLCHCLNVWYTGDDEALRAWAPKRRSIYESRGPHAQVNSWSGGHEFRVAYNLNHWTWTLTGRRDYCWVSDYPTSMEQEVLLVAAWAAAAGGLRTFQVCGGDGTWSGSGEKGVSVVLAAGPVRPFALHMFLSLRLHPISTAPTGPDGARDPLKRKDWNMLVRLLPEARFSSETLARVLESQEPQQNLVERMCVEAYNDLVAFLNVMLVDKWKPEWKAPSGAHVSVFVQPLTDNFDASGFISSYKCREGGRDYPVSPIRWRAYGKPSDFCIELDDSRCLMYSQKLGAHMRSAGFSFERLSGSPAYVKLPDFDPCAAAAASYCAPA